MSRNYRSDSFPWKFDVLKTSIFVLRISNFRGVTISRDSSSTETLHCLNRNTELAQAVDVMMVGVKIIYILMIEVKTKIVSFLRQVIF